MERTATGVIRLADVAQAVGVSAGTVSNVLNHPDRVRGDTRKRVLEAVDRLGYVPNSGARALAAGRSTEIGLVTGSLRHSFSVDIALGAQDEAIRHGLYLHMSTHDDSTELCEVHLKRQRAARVAGSALVVTEAPARMEELAGRVPGPLVLVNHRPRSDTVCWVAEDNDYVGELAVRHMVGLGRQGLLYVTLASERQSVAERLRAVQREAAAVGAELVVVAVAWDDPQVGGVIEEAIRLHAVDAVIAVTDMLGMLIIQHLTRLGVRIPDDVAVMGCDYNANAWGGSVPMTTITNQGYELGLEAVRLLIPQIESSDAAHVHRGLVLRPQLVERSSTIGH